MSHSKEAKSSSCNNASRGRSRSSQRDNARASTRSKSRPAEERIHSRTEASRRGRSRSISITRDVTACPPTTPSNNKSQHYRQHRSRSRSVHRSKAYSDHDNHDNSKKREEDANVEYGYEDSQVDQQQQQPQRVRPNVTRQGGPTRSTSSATAAAAAAASRIRRSKSMVGSLTAGIMDNDSSKKIMVTEYSSSVDQELLNQRRARRRMSSFGCTSDLTPGGAGARPTLSKELQKRRSQRRIQVETIQSRERMQAAIFDRALQRRNSFLGKHHHEEQQQQKQQQGESIARNSRSNRHDRVQEDGRPSSRSSSRSRRGLDAGSSSSHKRSSHHRSIQSSSHEYDDGDDDEEEDEKVRGDEHNRSQGELAHDNKPLPKLAPPRGSAHRRQLVLDDSQSMPKLAPLPPPRGSTHARQSLVNMILSNRDKGDDDDKDESDQDEFAEASWQEEPEPASERKPLPPNLNVSGGGRGKVNEEYFDNGMDEETIEETIVWSDEEKQEEIQHVERETQGHSQGRKRLPPKRNSKTAILEKAALGNALRKQAETEKYTPNPLVLNDVPLVPRDPFGDNSPLGTQRIRRPTLAVTAGAAKPPSQSSSFGKRNHSNNLTTVSGKRTSSASLGVLKLGKILDESQSTQLTISSSVSGNSGGSNSIESLQQRSKMLSLGNKFRHCKSQTDTKVTGDTKHLTKNVSML